MKINDREKYLIRFFDETQHEIDGDNQIHLNVTRTESFDNLSDGTAK